MIRVFKIFIILFLFQNSCLSMTSEKLNRLKWKAKTDIAVKAIELECSKENVGLEVDSEVGEQIFYSKPCKCAIKSGKAENNIVAQNILDICSL